MFSYEALRSRLAEGRFASEDTQDLLSPSSACPCSPPRKCMSSSKADAHARPVVRLRTAFDPGGVGPLSHHRKYNRVGADTHITPREIIRDFIELLNILLQNPGRRVEEILGGEEFLARRRRTAGTTAPLRSLACERGFRAPGPIYPGLYLCQSLGGSAEIQKEACQVVWDTDDNLLLSSGTASGKDGGGVSPGADRAVPPPLPVGRGVVH